MSNFSKGKEDPDKQSAFSKPDFLKQSRFSGRGGFGGKPQGSQKFNPSQFRTQHKGGS